MNLFFKLKMAKQKAEKLLRNEGMTELGIDPVALAVRHDIAVRAKPDTAEGVSGMLLRHGDNFGIMYATHIASQGFQHFSVAHELGHYFLEGHIDHMLPADGAHFSHAGFVSADPYEMEADHFAAGLLMPEAAFKRALDRRDPGLATVEELADLCKTSLTATAIRCVELTRDALAVIISTGNVVDYCFLSDGMKSLPDLSWIRKGSSVPVGTATADLGADAARVRSAERVSEEVSSTDWFGGTRSVTLSEEAVGLGRYGKTLTVLSSTTLGAAEEGYDDEEQEERDLVDSYEARFRK